jgi:hypothetical protein
VKRQTGCPDIICRARYIDVIGIIARVAEKIRGFILRVYRSGIYKNRYNKE